MSFTDQEIHYLRSQPLSRFATVSPDGQPDVVAVGFELHAGSFYIGGVNLPATRKFRNVRAGGKKVALIIDDLVSTEPWIPRFARIYGVADVIEHTGQFGRGPYIRVRPTTSWSWNLERMPIGHDDAQSMEPRRTTHHLPQAP